MDFSFTTIIIIILLIIIVYFVWTMLSSSSTTVSSGGLDASKPTPMTVTASYSFTISTWVYVNSWDSTIPKTIVSTPKDSKSPFSLTLGNSANNSNDLYITIGDQSIPLKGATSIVSIPLQTWASIIATVNSGNSLDIYINGKLVQTTVLDKVYGLPAGTINVGGGIDGYISSTFDSTPFGPQDAWNTYSSGYGSGGGSSVTDFFNKYKVRFAFVKDNVELSRLDI
uniref:Lectin/glucanase superfamily protein n=1 Tax=viral metagenome TaxID=1070528 RepID=A0A6C0I1C7_9ZZZZ